jgi:hypothetical protein
MLTFLREARVAMRRLILVAVVLVGCSGGAKPAEVPPPQSKGPVSAATHEALVAAHRSAVGACFGGFGKGMPYAVAMKVAKGKVTAAEASPLGEKYGAFPKECVEKHFAGADLAGTDQKELRARFAVRNPACDRPACPPDDLPCTARRDIACSVVVDE